MPMSAVAASSPPIVWTTVADLFEQLGQVPPDRVRLVPTPGTATEQDVLDLIDHAELTSNRRRSFCSCRYVATALSNFGNVKAASIVSSISGIIAIFMKS
jgi:hypothetical protein